MDKTTETIAFATYGDFMTALKNAYDDPDAKATAERKIRNLKQGTKDCSMYVAEFMTYASLLSFDDCTKIYMFTNGAHQDLKIALSYQADPPEQWDDFVQLCIKLDNHARMLRSNRQQTPAAPWAPRPGRTPSASTSTGTAAGPIDLSQVNQTPQKRGPISPELRNYHDDNGLCHYCGGTGHWASNCPLSQRTKRINTMGPAPPPPPPVPGFAPPAAAAAPATTSAPLYETKHEGPL